MLFTEAELCCNDAFRILDEAVYLTQEETLMRAQMVPIIKSSDFQGYHIPFYALKALAESNGYNLSKAIVNVCSVDGIDPSNVTVSMLEEDLVNLKEVQELGNVAISPISERNRMYQDIASLCEDCLNNDTLDYLMEAVCNEIAFITNFAKGKAKSMSDAKYGDTIRDLTTKKDKMMHLYHSAWNQLGPSGPYNQNTNQWEPHRRFGYKPSHLHRHPKLTKDDTESLQSRINGRWQTAGLEWMNRINAVKDKRNRYRNRIENGLNYGLHSTLLGGTVGAAYGTFKAIQAYRNKPKSVIAKKIASLRKIYSKWMKKAQSSKDSGIAAKLKRGAAKILEVIDKLMAFLQRKADNR